MKYIKKFILVIIVLILTNCQSTSNTPNINTHTRNVGKLTLNVKSLQDFVNPFSEGDYFTYYGKPYWGYYEGVNGFKNQVAVFIRSVSETEGFINRAIVIPQGGTGTDLRGSFNFEPGLHRVAIFVPLRGNYINFASPVIEFECPLGTRLLKCLNDNKNFKLATPKGTAEDTADVVKIFRENLTFTVDGKDTNAKEFFPNEVDFYKINFLTDSFGGVIFGHLLADVNAPQLNDVYLRQVTSPIERPISDGLILGKRRFDILFESCEKDLKCNKKYPNLRNNIINWFNAHHETSAQIDGVGRTSGFIFDNLDFILSKSDSLPGTSVAGAISYLGEISKNYTNDSTNFSTIVSYSLSTAGEIKQSGGFKYEGSWGPAPKFSEYGFPSFTDTKIETISEAFPILFPNLPQYSIYGFTNRIAMICTFGINRNEIADSTKVLDNLLKDPNYSTFKYGFLVAYRVFLDFCPQIINITGLSSIPKPRNVNANRVLIYSGGLDIKHSYEDADEIASYFSSGTNIKNLKHKYLTQDTGPLVDRNCFRKVINDFWKPNSDFPNCDSTNSLTVSSLSEAGSLFD